MINYEEIAINTLSRVPTHLKLQIVNWDKSIDEAVINAMKEAVRQSIPIVVDKCAEAARIEEYDRVVREWRPVNTIDFRVDKDSILSIKKELKKEV